MAVTAAVLTKRMGAQDHHDRVRRTDGFIKRLNRTWRASTRKFSRAIVGTTCAITDHP
jgi:hypothetical protein